MSMELPEHWVSAKLGDITEIVGGGTPDRSQSEYFQGDIPWVSPTDITKLNDIWIDQTAESITEKGLRKSSAVLLPVGSVLMTCRASFGLVAINRRAMCTSQSLYSFVCNESLIYNEYLARLLASMKDRLSRLAGETTFKGISKSSLSGVVVSLPPLPEQRRIASILREADEIRKLRKQANERTQGIVQALFYDMFGDPATNSKGWKASLLSNEGILDRGKSQHRPRDAAHLYGGPYPFIQTGDVANSNGLIAKYSQTYSDAGLAQSRLWKKDTLCVTIAANIAKTAIITFDACFPDSIVGFLPGSRVTVEYVRQWFVCIQSNLEKLAPQAAQKNINLEVLRNLQIIVPPILLQQKFTSLFREVYDTIGQQDIANHRLDTFYQSLLSQAFTGELTATWRRAHAIELAQVAKERDLLLGNVLPKPTVYEVEPAFPTQPEVLITDERSTLIETLSPLQSALYNLMQKRKDIYFAATKLHSDVQTCIDEYNEYHVEQDAERLYQDFAGLNCSLDTLRRELRALAMMGLAREAALSVEDEDAPDTVRYVTVYRFLQVDDDCQHDDLVIINPETAQEVLV